MFQKIPAATGESLVRYATFYVADLFFGIDVLQVQEVLRGQAMTRVPLAPDVVKGLINLRGQIVTAIDIRQRMNVKPREEGQEPMNIVVCAEEGVVEQRELIEGLYKLEGRLLLVLNTERVLQSNSV